MAIEKQTLIGKIEISPDGVIRVKEVTSLIEDGQVFTQTNHRRSIVPGQDYSNEPEMLKKICAATHTPEIIAAFEAARATE